MTPSWRDLLAEVSSGLGGSPSPHEESRLILQHAARMPWPALAARLDEPAAPKVAARARHLAAARRGGRPLQHVLGRWGFRRIDVAVDGRALVPRPETEVVVEVALELVEALGISGRPALAVDLGTGSGVIALSLATERDDLDAVGVDRSADALALAAENLTLVSAAHPGLAARVSFLRGDFYGALRPGMRGAVDLVVANPPYVAEREWAGLEPVVRDHDPYEALVAGPSGLEAIEAVVTGAPGVLRRPGALAVEIAPHQAEVAVRLAERGGLVDVAVRPDLAGRPRVLVASHL